eukprot:CAMPEP_0204916384 /NCGR_PEP_ID=MMETSP1397-20131031/14205_1 /ASSEMBLY_ACC=CAM_ASM_000891 /TAXON_ID=49980 /ORGANISM="Climacostomum Climacostomum virens, Strain Stock W-24" /LENGTH=47 /DNA_ID= /DNA_START= /DNA_END= /DNA_ORIENTATION=
MSEVLDVPDLESAVAAVAQEIDKSGDTDMPVTVSVCPDNLKAIELEW